MCDKTVCVAIYSDEGINNFVKLRVSDPIFYRKNGSCELYVRHLNGYCILPLEDYKKLCGKTSHDLICESIADIKINELRTPQKRNFFDRSNNITNNIILCKEHSIGTPLKIKGFKRGIYIGNEFYSGNWEVIHIERDYAMIPREEYHLLKKEDVKKYWLDNKNLFDRIIDVFKKLFN